MANEKTYIEELKKRDTAMPMKKYIFKSKDFAGHDPLDICPLCESVIALEKFRFCPVCGQRLDRDNYEFQ